MSTVGSAGTGFNPYTGQLAVTVHDHGAASQWNDGKCFTTTIDKNLQDIFESDLPTKQGWKPLLKKKKKIVINNRKII